MRKPKRRRQKKLEREPTFADVAVEAIELERFAKTINGLRMSGKTAYKFFKHAIRK